jgi:hypothetical protein
MRRAVMAHVESPAVPRSRPFVVVPASHEEQMLALALQTHREQLTAPTPDKAASITPLQISAITIAPVLVAPVSNSTVSDQE